MGVHKSVVLFVGDILVRINEFILTITHLIFRRILKDTSITFNVIITRVSNDVMISILNGILPWI